MTHLFCIIDRSGSMTGLEKPTISGYNEYLKGLRNEDNLRVTTVLFDNEIIYLNNNCPIKKAKKLNNENYIPRGGTALVDAVCGTVNKYKNKVKKDDKALVLIITDGEENSSTEYTSNQLKKIIKGLEKKNWTFTYLGANQDAWSVSKKFGFSHGNVATYKASGTGTLRAYASMASNTHVYFASATGNVSSFYEKDKDDLKNA